MRLTLLFLLSLAACSSEEPTNTVSKQKKGRAAKAETTDSSWDTAEVEADVLIPEVVEFVIHPAEPQATDVLKLQVQIKQPTGGRVKPRFQWFKGSTPIEGQTQRQLRPGFFKKGDWVSAEVYFLGDDGERIATRKSQQVSIANTGPDMRISGSSRDIDFSKPYPIQATDIDGDDLKFVLKGQPPGMSIKKTGKQTAELIYTDSASAKAGEYKVTVIAADEEKTAEWTMTLNVNKILVKPSDSSGLSTRSNKNEPSKSTSEPVEDPDAEDYESGASAF